VVPHLVGGRRALSRAPTKHAPHQPTHQQDIIPEDKQPELLGNIQKGNVSMRVMRDVFESFLNMGPLSQVRR
jgi:hypothetical protein